MSTNAKPVLTRPRVARLFKLCQSPGAAGRTAARVRALAMRTGSESLTWLSDALHEQRHVARELLNGNQAAAAKHSEVVGICIGRAVRVSS